MSDPKLSRGYRNKNPGNVDFNSKNKWLGQVGIEAGVKPRFAVFETHEYGIRALAALLTTYSDRYGLTTARGIINRWAPPAENITSSYVTAVSAAMNVLPGDTINLHTYEHLRPMVQAIISHELGGNPYSDAVLDEGLKLAGVAKPVATVSAAASTKTGIAAITVGSVSAAAAAVAPAMQVLSGLPQWVGVAAIVAAAVVAVVVVLVNRRDA